MTEKWQANPRKWVSVHNSERFEIVIQDCRDVLYSNIQYGELTLLVLTSYRMMAAIFDPEVFLISVDSVSI